MAIFGIAFQLAVITFVLVSTQINALQTTRVIRLTLAVCKATYLPFQGSRYLQNGKIMENTGESWKSIPRCPYGYPEYKESWKSIPRCPYRYPEYKESWKSIPRCPYGYRVYQAGLCYKPCVRRSDWAFARQVGPLCRGCPSSHPSEEASLCYRNCPRNYPHKSNGKCFGNCPGGYRLIGNGLTCFRAPHIFGSNKSSCPWYDKCGLWFRNSKGCSECPRGYRNHGCLCKKTSHAILRPNYNRGAGVAFKSYSSIGKMRLTEPTYESFYDTPACSIGNWQAISHVNRDTEILKFANDNQRVIVFGFTGTNQDIDWQKNWNTSLSRTVVKRNIFWLHAGFKTAYMNIARWFESQYRLAISTGYKIILTGHSLGAAEATIAAVYAAGKLNRAPDAVVTYGSPLTGDEDFASYYRKVVGCGRTLRFVAKGDKVAYIPPPLFGYDHVCGATNVDGGGGSVRVAHNLYDGYQNGIARKYGNTNTISAGCDTAF